MGETALLLSFNEYLSHDKFLLKYQKLVLFSSCNGLKMFSFVLTCQNYNITKKWKKLQYFGLDVRLHTKPPDLYDYYLLFVPLWNHY